MSNFSYINNADPAYIDSLYQAYKEDNESVDFGWQNSLKDLISGKMAPPGILRQPPQTTY